MGRIAQTSKQTKQGVDKYLSKNPQARKYTETYINKCKCIDKLLEAPGHGKLKVAMEMELVPYDTLMPFITFDKSFSENSKNNLKFVSLAVRAIIGWEGKGKDFYREKFGSEDVAKALKQFFLDIAKDTQTFWNSMNGNLRGNLGLRYPYLDTL